MTTKEKRILFTRCVELLLRKMIEDGMKPMVGRDGLPHKKNSLHFDGLAIDIDLCDQNGAYLKNTEAHQKYGEYWESLHELCFWGGKGLKPDTLQNDGNHYSVTDLGRK